MSGPPPEVAAPLHERILVVFTGAADLWWLRLLRPGFRHCFAALFDGHRWITVDPLSHRTEVVVQEVPHGFDLAAHYRSRGLTVVEVAALPAPLKPAPPGLHSCVESVKRLVGVHSMLVLTPWQLHRRLGRLQAREPGDSKNRNLHLEYQESSPILRRATARLARFTPRSARRLARHCPEGGSDGSPVQHPQGTAAAATAGARHHGPGGRAPASPAGSAGAAPPGTHRYHRDLEPGNPQGQRSGIRTQAAPGRIK